MYISNISGHKLKTSIIMKFVQTKSNEHCMFPMYTILANYFVKACISIYGLSTDGLYHRCFSFELKIASFEITFVTLDHFTFLLIFLKMPRLPTSST